MNATTFRYEDSVLIVNATYDDLRDFDDEYAKQAQAAYDGPHPEEVYGARLPGEGGIYTGADGRELTFHGVTAHEGKLYVVMEMAYHYRNDASRHKWGGSADKPEDHLPSQDTMTTLARADFERAKSREHVELCENEYKQPDGTSTDDRHLILMLFPIDEIETAEKLVDRCIAAVA